MKDTGRRIVIATVIAGTLDILAAITLTLYFGRPVGGMLRYVASGPFPAATAWGAPGAVLGLATHYILMAVMVAAYMLAARRYLALVRAPILWGVMYGLATYVIMNLIVVHFRFATQLPPSTISIVSQLFCHIVLVGIPIALIASKRQAA